jgi:hypothetical protein
MNIRLETGLIIRKDNEYLVGRVIYTGELRWSLSPWDAWKTRVRANARSIADKTGGEIMLWNPVAGQLRKANI